MLKKSLIISVSLFLIGSISSAIVPQLINYQGWLTDRHGNPLNAPETAPVSVQFKIYDSETNGNVLWSETQSVTVVDGIFSVLLGSVTPIPYSVFDGNNRYFALKVESDSEMMPRKRLVSVGYSFRAHNSDMLNGKEDSSFVQTMDGVSPNGRGNVDLVAGSNVVITPDDINNRITISATPGSGGDNLGDHTASQNIILNEHWLSGDGEGEGVYVDNAGNVGIGKTDPIEVLDVEGNIVTSGDIMVDSTTYGSQSINLEPDKTFSIGNVLHIRDNKVAITGTKPQAKLHLNGIPGVDGIMFPDGTLQTTAADTSLLNTLTVSETGNVGIGTSSPVWEFEVANLTPGDGAESGITANDAGGALAAYSSTLPAPFGHYAGRVSLFSNISTRGLDLRADSSHGDIRFYTGGWTPLNERMRITNTGSVGIGTTSPNSELEIYSKFAPTLQFTTSYSGQSDYDGLKLSMLSNGYATIMNQEDGYLALGTNGAYRIYINNWGNVGIGTSNPNYKLDVRGTIGNNATLYHSDIRWKKKIQTLDNALETTLALRGVQFEWRRDEFPEMNFSERKRIGLIAQEVETVIPELVTTGKDGYKSVEYTNLVALLIEAVKDQQKEIESLKFQTAQLTTSLHRIEKLLIVQENSSTIDVDKNNRLAIIK